MSPRGDVKTAGLRLGIRQKMILVLLTVLTVSLSVTGWITLEEYRDSTYRQIQRDGSKLARFVAESLVYSVVGYDYHTIQLMLDKLVASGDVVYAQVQNARGKGMANAGNRDAAGENVKIFAEDIVFEGELVGKLAIGVDTNPIVQDLAQQRSHVIQREGLIVLLIAIGEFVVISLIVVRPVRFIHRFLGKTEENLAQRIPPIPFSTRDEFSELGGVFNSLLDTLQRRQNDLRFALGQAEQATRAKSAFLANISHQFRTPLNAILGYEQVLRQDQKLASQHDRSLQAIAHAGTQLLALVDQVIAVAKGEATGMDVQNSDFDVVALIAELRQKTAADCARKNLTCAFDVLHGEPRQWVHGDMAKLRDVLATLLDNAVKFTREGGVELRIKRESASAVSFAVRDSGAGIDAAHQETFFKAFAGDEQRLQHGGNDVGVSLALAYRQVEAMGGRLAVESQLGHGSEFTFKIELPPVAQAENLQTRADSAPNVLPVDAQAIDVAAADAKPDVERSSPATPTAALPAEWLQQLEDAADMGLLSQVQDLIKTLRDSEPAVAAHLKKLTDDLNLDEVAAWAKRARS